MGWSIGPRPYEGAKAFMDKQHTWSSESGTRRVLKSAIKRFRVYYAAVEHTRPDGSVRVWASVSLLTFTGGEFGYKFQDETVGPNDFDCPADIFALLSPEPENDYARDWRKKVEAYHAHKKATRLTDGATVRFSGQWLDASVWVARKIKGGWRFNRPGIAESYNLRGWRNRVLSVEEPA